MIINDLKLRSMLHAQRKSQSWLSDTSGISRNTINAVCNGKSCSTCTAQKIADTLGLDLSELEYHTK